MSALLQYGGALLGFVLGFVLGMMALTHITRGEKMKELLENGEKKFWLGALGWFFAAAGAWIGWQLGSFAAAAWGS